jgi:pimeloyl-ACP methyl ester carboxylesterase
VSGVEARAGYRSYRIAYRTNRDPQTSGVGTGRLYVPNISGPRPVVVVAHGTAGLADQCALSLYAPQATSDVLAIPWVTSGFVTVLPDYAGLGNAGVQGYGNRIDTTFSTIDAGRAATTLLNTLPQLIIIGHSQGGGVALSAQALTQDYGAPDVELIAAISVAGNLSEDRVLQALRFPNLSVGGGDGVTLAVTLLNFYADWANIVGEERGGEIFNPTIRDHVLSSIHNDCIYDLVTAVNTSVGDYEVPNTMGEIINPMIREAIVACDRDSDCNEQSTAYVQRHRTNTSPPDSEGAPVLMLSGGDDIQSPLSRQACTRDYLQAAGVMPTTCAFTDRDHFSIPEASIAHALAWVEAILESRPQPPCPDSLIYPQCPN